MAIVCTSAGCGAGRAMVGRMRSTFDHLESTNPLFRGDHYEPAVVSIEASLAETDSWYAGLIPFNPVCCVIEDIGKRADSLTNDMLSSVGAASVPTPPPEANPLKLIIVAVGLIVFLFVIVELKNLKGALT